MSPRIELSVDSVGACSSSPFITHWEMKTETEEAVADRQVETQHMIHSN